jgi:hypothetical protein
VSSSSGMTYTFPIEIALLFLLLTHLFQLEKCQAQAATGQIEWMEAFAFVLSSACTTLIPSISASAYNFAYVLVQMYFGTLLRRLGLFLYNSLGTRNAVSTLNQFTSIDLHMVHGFGRHTCRFRIPVIASQACQFTRIISFTCLMMKPIGHVMRGS